jgi:hypothetical protein
MKGKEASYARSAPSKCLRSLPMAVSKTRPSRKSCARIIRNLNVKSHCSFSTWTNKLWKGLSRALPSTCSLIGQVD